MKYFLFFSLSVSFHAYFLVQCEFIRKTSYLLPGPENPSLVLAIDERTKFGAIPYFTIDVTKKAATITKFLFLCPAESDAERELLNQRRSNTKNTLFVRDTFRYEDAKLDQNPTEERQLGEDKTELDSKDFKNKYLEYNCKDPVKPSTRYAAPDGTYGIYCIGFEVFFDENEYKELETMYTILEEDNQEFKWFELMAIRFDQKNGNVLSVSNNVVPLLASRSQRKNLNEYSPFDPRINTISSEVFYEGVDVNALYSLDNQRDVFINKLFKDPSSSNTYEYINETEHRYLVENHLSPLRDFVTPLLQKAAHNYGNIAPMWKIIKDESWARVETEVEHLVQNYGTKIFVITGTYGTLKLENQEIHLGFEKKYIRVPMAFWKIVEFKASKSLFFNILIVTLNNPYEDVSIDLCPISQSQCKEYGWDNVVQDSYSWGRTLCCEVTKENIDKLEMQGLSLVNLDAMILNLRHISRYFPTEVETESEEDEKKQG